MRSNSIIVKYKDYWLLAVNFLFSLVLFQFAYLFQSHFHYVMDFASYLTWHNIFEFTGIVVSFGVFVVTYFTYKQTGSLRSMLFGCIFFLVGTLDFFHALSFKGMPAFLIPNDSANRATTFWIIGGLVTSAGFLACVSISKQKRSTVSKSIFFLGAILFDLAALIISTYYPGVLPKMYVDGYGLTNIKVILEWVIILFFCITAGILLIQIKEQKNGYNIAFVHALILRIFSEAAFTAYGSVYDIYNYLGHIYKFVSVFIFFEIMFIYNVKKPYMELSQARKDLERYVNNLDKLVAERTSQLNEMNQKLMDDLEYAKDIQSSLLPNTLPYEQEVSFEARYYPADRVSGDFYNVQKLDDETVAIYIGDVSGHGVPAAMLTVFVNQSIKYSKENQAGGSDILMPSEVLDNLYYSFNRTNFKEDVYIVLFYAIYNFKTKIFTYASGGLNAIPLKIAGDRQVEHLQARGFPICKFDEYYVPQYEDHKISLRSGEQILFYTDGLTEVRNQEGVSFEEKGLLQLMDRQEGPQGQPLAAVIEGSLFEFMGKRQLKDDITFLVMKVH